VGLGIEHGIDPILTDAWQQAAGVFHLLQFFDDTLFAEGEPLLPASTDRRAEESPPVPRFLYL
jgi:hypothetical protein